MARFNWAGRSQEKSVPQAATWQKQDTTVYRAKAKDSLNRKVEQSRKKRNVVVTLPKLNLAD